MEWMKYEIFYPLMINTQSWFNNENIFKDIKNQKINSCVLKYKTNENKL